MSWRCQKKFAARFSDITSHVRFHPSSDRGLSMPGAKEFVGAARAAGPTVAGCKIVSENICSWNTVLVDQPPNKRRRSSGLRRSEGVVFAADMFDADGTFVRSHAMVRPITVFYHLIDVAVAIDDIVRGHLPAF